MNVIIRVDSSAQIGSGHLMRCLTLAKALREAGVTVSFVCRLLEGHLISKLESEAFFVHKLPAIPLVTIAHSADYSAWLGVSQDQDAEETLSTLDGKNYDWLVVDHYALDCEWEIKLRHCFSKLMVIDDLANRYHDCDLLLDQNYFGAQASDRYVNYVSATTKLLLGPKYALLGAEYATLKALLIPSDGLISRVLVFLGNTDQSDQTSRILQALSYPELAHVAVDVVLGTNHPNKKKVEQLASNRGSVNVHYSIPSLAMLMLRCDLMISAGGATTWERMCLEKPAIAVCVAENQHEFSLHLANEGYQVSIYDSNICTSEVWYKEILKFISNPSKARAMGKQAGQLLDGFGTERVRKILLNSEQINTRAVNASDEPLLFDWANNELVRQQSFQQSIITKEEHAKWFKAKMLDRSSFMYIAETIMNEPIGLVRFQLAKNAETASVGISTASEMRGRGLGAKMLFMAMGKLLDIVPNVTFVAEIRSENVASQNLFRKLGFVQIEQASTSGAVQLVFQAENGKRVNQLDLARAATAAI